MKRVIAAIVTIAVLSYAALGSIFCALTVVLNHDEHQFMASACMVARHGIHPYRDFAYFQMPNLVYVYSLCFFTGHPFLVARLFNGLCGFALCLIVFLTARFLFRSLGSLSATLIAASAAVLLPSTVVFQYTASKAWNHSSATLCAVLAFVLQCKAIRQARWSWFAFSGFALGMALGIRLTFAPLLAPFVIAILIFDVASWRKKFWNVVAFALGVLLANVPAFYFFLTRYRDFTFDTFTYRQLDPQYLRSLPVPPGAMNFADKIRLLIESFRSDAGSLAVAAFACVSVIVLTIATIRRSTKPRFEVIFLIGLIPFLLVGYFAPDPAQFQYGFALIPFLLLLGLYSLSDVKIDNRILPSLAVIILLALLCFDAAKMRQRLVTLGRVFQPRYWVPLQVEKTSQWMRQQLESKSSGKILTLSPIFAIEAGLPIYNEFVTGPFAWRVSHLLSAEEAAARKFPWSPGLAEFLKRDPPAAVLTGLEPKADLEAPIIREITALGYQPIDAPNGGVLWLPRQ